MNFLNSGETFLGVLLTLNVLCIFAERSSNFILRILLEQRQRFTKILTERQNEVNERIKAFQETDRYKKIDAIVAGVTNKSAEIISQATIIKFNYNIELKASQTDLSSCYSTMDRIESSNEQFRAPFFSLLFGLIIFALNQSFQWFSYGVALKMLPVVWIFTLLACIYWGAIWVAFSTRSMLCDETLTVSDKSIWRRIDSKLHLFWGGCIKLILCGAILAIILNYVDFNGISQTVQVLIVVGGSIALITILGVWRLIECAVKGRFSAMHMLGHLCAFFIYAVMITIVYNIWGNGVCDRFFYNTTALCGLILFFSLLNGIIFPFLLPYLKYRKPYENAMEHLENQNESFDKVIDSFNEGYKEMTERAFMRD